MLATTEGPHTNVGVPLLRLLAAIGTATGDEELRRQINLNATTPLLRINIFNRAGGTSNPGIVN